MDEKDLPKDLQYLKPFLCAENPYKAILDDLSGFINSITTAEKKETVIQNTQTGIPYRPYPSMDLLPNPYKLYLKMVECFYKGRPYSRIDTYNDILDCLDKNDEILMFLMTVSPAWKILLVYRVAIYDFDIRPQMLRNLSTFMKKYKTFIKDHEINLENKEKEKYFGRTLKSMENFESRNYFSQPVYVDLIKIGDILDKIIDKKDKGVIEYVERKFTEGKSKDVYSLLARSMEFVEDNDVARSIFVKFTKFCPRTYRLRINRNKNFV